MKNKFGLIYWANKISLQKSAGQLERLSSLLAKSTIDLNPHQIYACIYALNSPLARGAVLADEVGLGKTIEAGIIISQLWLEEKRRILIVVPASLRTQWREELEKHFGLDPVILDTPYFDEQVNSGNPVPMTEEGIYIASLPFVYNRIQLVEKQPWDLVVVDEAHRLRRVYRGRDASKMAFDLRNAIKDKPKLLLTATPIQNNLMELYGLVSFIDDKLLGSKYHFKSRFVDSISEYPRSKNQRLQNLRDTILGKNIEERDLFSPSGVVVRTLRKQVKGYINFPPRKSMTQDFTPTPKEQELYEKVSDYLSKPEIAAIKATQRNLMILVYRKLLASSSFAIAPTLKKLYERLERELELRNIEENAPDLAEEIKKRKVTSDDVEDIEEIEKLEEELESKGRVSHDFSNEEIEDEINKLKEYYELAVSIQENTKGKALVKALKKLFAQAEKKNWPQKAVVFTESRRTQEYLSRVLKKNDFSFTLFNGSNDSKQAREAYQRWKKEFPELAMNMSKKVGAREALIYDFKTRSQILLTTGAGREGLNLQFCNIVINYDLPWNPQRVEQRIGRCHRYGQEYEVVVANMLNTKNYADKRVLELIQKKLKLFDGLFGASDEILGALESGVDFEKKICDIYQSCRTPEEIDAAFQELQDKIKTELTSEIREVRSSVLEHFDAPILKLFKKTKNRLNQVLTEYDKSLLRLCKLYFGDKINPTPDPGIYTIETEGEKKNYLFREEKEEEIGKIPRIHSDHKLIRKIRKEVESLSTKPIQKLKFKYSSSNQSLGELNQLIEKEGYIYLFKLTIKGIEEDEILAPLAFVKRNGDYTPLSNEASNFLVELPSEPVDEEENKSPISRKKLLKEWEKWRKNTVKKFEKRNEKLYAREENRIERYWDSQTTKVEDKIEKVESNVKEMKQKKYNTIDFEKKRKLSQKIQKAELELQRLKIKKTKEEAKALKSKQEDIRKLNERLELNIQEKLIAIAKFEIT